MIDQLIYQYLRMCVPSFRAREGYRLTVSEVHVLGTSLSLYLLARIPPSERERFHGLVFWFGKRRILTTYLTLPYHQDALFFRAMKTAATRLHLFFALYLLSFESTSV